MTKEFKEAVASKNLKYVRMMLSNELIFDPRAKSFAEMLAYAKDRLPDLFEEEVASQFSIPADKALWNKKVLSEMKRDLNMNFSVEKLALYVEMAKFVGAVKADELEKKEIERNAAKILGETDGSIHAEEERKKSNKTTGRIVTGSGVVIEIIGLCVKSSLLSILGGVAIVAGVTLLVASKKK